jgi:hypothetical protein
MHFIVFWGSEGTPKYYKMTKVSYNTSAREEIEWQKSISHSCACASSG